MSYVSSIDPLFTDLLHGQLKVAEGASSALRGLYGTRYTSGPGAATICKYTTARRAVPLHTPQKHTEREQRAPSMPGFIIDMANCKKRGSIYL
jgi:hypothetical protein